MTVAGAEGRVSDRYAEEFVERVEEDIEMVAPKREASNNAARPSERNVGDMVAVEMIPDE